jgi:hypothetical protein
MVKRLRSFPDDPDRFEHFVPDVDCDEYQRYVELNPAHAFSKGDTRGQDELAEIFFDRQGELRTNGNEVVQLANLVQESVRARLHQIEGNRAWQSRRARNTADFRQSPRTFWKTMGETLSAPADRIVVSRRDTAREVAAAMVVDPQRLTSTLLRNLGVEDPVTEKGLLMEDRLALRSRAVPDVKRALARLEPIRRPDEEGATLGDLRYFRMMRVAAGPREGMLVGTQHILGQKIIFGTDLRGAERRLHHIRYSYEEEVQKLTWIQGVILNLRAHLDFWKRPEHAADLEKLFATMKQIVDSLEHVQDDHKRKMLEQLEDCTDVNDKRGRANPASKQARLSKASESLGKRIKNIESISKHLGEDHVKVLGVVVGQKDPLKGVRQRMEQKKPWEEQFRAFEAAVRGVHYEPDLGFARQAQAHVQSINTKLATGKREEARTEYVALFVLCKLKEAYDGIWDIYRRISIQPASQKPEDLEHKLEGIQAKLHDHSFAEQTETRAYWGSFRKMYHLINSLKKRLRELQGKEPVSAPSADEVKQENQTLLGLLQGLRGQSEVLDRLLAAVRTNPQLNLRDLLPYDVDPDQQEETYKRMKTRIAEVDFNELLKVA